MLESAAAVEREAGSYFQACETAFRSDPESVVVLENEVRHGRDVKDNGLPKGQLIATNVSPNESIFTLFRPDPGQLVDYVMRQSLRKRSPEGELLTQTEIFTMKDGSVQKTEAEWVNGKKGFTVIDQKLNLEEMREAEKLVSEKFS